MIAIVVFLFFVGVVLALSFYLGSRAKSAKGYFAAHGQIGWFVNGIAFAGDYLSFFLLSMSLPYSAHLLQESVNKR